MNQNHLGEILEALRGKIIIHKIVLWYETPPSEFILETPLNFGISINKEEKSIDLLFQPKFLTYVQWPYSLAIEQIQKLTNEIKSLDIYVSQLFEDKNNGFTLKFNENGLIFQNRRNIEDTLFLDLQRYCEHNKIHYEVM